MISLTQDLLLLSWIVVAFVPVVDVFPTWISFLTPFFKDESGLTSVMIYYHSIRYDNKLSL